jgi:ribonucleotide monophosphatase NagD (HAD superfamily)
MDLPADFQELIDEKTRNDIVDDNVHDYMTLASEEVLLEYINKMEPSASAAAIYFLKSDESRLKALNFKNVKKEYDRICAVIYSFEDESLKLKHLHYKQNLHF